MADAQKTEKIEKSEESFYHGTRAISPVIGKTFELGIIVVFVSLLTVALYGGIVPEYRTSAGAEVGDRTLVAAAERIEGAIPPNATHVRSETRIDIPRTIRGESYQLRVVSETLVLDHPNQRIAGRTPLALPNSVVSVSGAWASGDETLIVVRKTHRGVTVELEVRG